MPTPPANPGRSPFVSALPSPAASSISVHEDSCERHSSTGLDGTGGGTAVEIAQQKHNNGLESPAPNPPVRYVPVTSPAERPARPLVRRSRTTFTSSLGHSIIEE
ncbi:hypothetical protein Q7P35_004199 [Cladosporium inversicolor]